MQNTQNVMNRTIWVKNRCNKLNQRWLVGIFLGKGHCQAEDAALPGSILRASNHADPLTQIQLIWSPTDALRWLGLQRVEITHQTSAGRCGHFPLIGEAALLYSEWFVLVKTKQLQCKIRSESLCVTAGPAWRVWGVGKHALYGMPAL